MRRFFIALGVVLGLLLHCAIVGWAVFLFQPFGHRAWTFFAVLAILIGIVLFFRSLASRQASDAVGSRASYRRSKKLFRKVYMAGLGIWLGLIAWSAASPGGAMPLPKGDPVAIRVLTWNILLGSDTGLPQSRHGWPVRKRALREVVASAAPDILCVQEALSGQVTFLEENLPGHRREGGGRDDGVSAGEHCAIFFSTQRFDRLDGGTFWLEEPSDEPPAKKPIMPKRICTWVRLKDRTSGRTFRVYNAHNYLTEGAQLRAAMIILARMKSGDANDEILLAGDYNASPKSVSRTIFTSAGLTAAATSAGVRGDTPTYQFYGIHMRSLDEIYASKGVKIKTRRVIDAKPGNTFPSDHFGVMVDLMLGE